MMKQPIPIVVLNGTYIYIQTSAEYVFQGMSFNMHFDVTQCLCACIHR